MYHQNWLEEMDQIFCCKSSRSREIMGIRNRMRGSCVLVLCCVLSILTANNVGATSSQQVKCWSTKTTVSNIKTTTTTATVINPNDPFQQLSLPSFSSSPSSSFNEPGDEIFCSIPDLHILNFTSSIFSAAGGRLDTIAKLQIQCSNSNVPTVLSSKLFQRPVAVNLHSFAIKNCIGYIEKNFFEHWIRIRTLDVSGNSIWGIPDKALCPLRSLQNLNISGNAVSDLNELGVSSGDCGIGESLQNLDLSFNSLRRVTKFGFRHLQQLRMVNLSSNMIEELDDMAFTGINNIRSLDLSSNRLFAIPPQIFNNTEHLKELFLENNSLSFLSPDLFSGLIRLVILNLNNNKLKHVDSDVFRGLVQLQALYLKNNLITSIHPKAFTSLPNLTILHLQNNKIVSINGLFATATNTVLRELNLDHNMINSIDDEAFKNCSLSLTDLGLAGNRLVSIPEALKGLKALTTLDIGENRISSLRNDSFLGMSQLIGLRLVDNDIEELPKGLCDPISRLRVLNVAENKISKLSRNSISACRELQILRLDSNKLATMPSDLPSNVLFLNLSSNLLTTVTNIPKSVEWLDVSNNKLEYLVGFSSPTLRVLDASFNLVKELDIRTISPQLETLRLNHNRLTKVASNTFIRSTRLRRVELVGNMLKNLELNAIQIPTVQSGKPSPEFYIANNNFTCDCSMEWLLKINQPTPSRQYATVGDLEAVTCTPTFTGNNQLSPVPVPVMRLEQNDFLCSYVSHCPVSCECCSFLCDCEMVCSPGCSCFHSSGWEENIVSCHNSNLTEIPHNIPMGVTVVHLDNNNIPTIKAHMFIGRKKMRTLFLNGSRIQTIQSRAFHSLKSLETLHLEHNLLTDLFGWEFENLRSLQELYLHNNRIRHISKDTFSQLVSLEKLSLHGNELSLYDFSVWEADSHLNSLSLSGNPWTCECDFIIPFRQWAVSFKNIVDFENATCTGERKQTISSACTQLPFKNHDTPSAVSASFSNSGSNNHIALMNISTGDDESKRPNASHGEESFIFYMLLVISIVIILVACIAFLVVLVRRRVSWNGKSSSNSSSVNESGTGGIGNMDGYLFNGFIIYSKNKKDEEIAKKLEGVGVSNLRHPQLRFCLIHRDVNVSPENPWSNEILTSLVLSSDKIFIVVSNNFLNGEWTNDHFRTCIRSAIQQHCRKLVFIRVPPVPASGSVFCSSFSVPSTATLDWGEGEIFWTKFMEMFQTSHGTTNLQLPYTTNFNHQSASFVETNLACIPNIIPSHPCQLRYYSPPPPPPLSLGRRPSQLTPREFEFGNCAELAEAIYSSIDSHYSYTPQQDLSPCSEITECQFEGSNMNRNRHQIQNSTSSGISSGSGESCTTGVISRPMYFV